VNRHPERLDLDAMGRRASASALDVKGKDNFSKIRTPSRLRLDEASSPTSSRAKTASPQPTSSSSPRTAVDVGLSREAYSKARNMLIAARKSNVGFEDEEATESKEETSGFKRVGKALVSGMSEALTSRRSSGRNQNLMKSLMAAISREKIGAKLAELGLDDIVSEFLGHIYEGMIELQIDDFSSVEDALNGLLDSSVAGEAGWMEFVGNLQASLMDCLDSMIQKHPTAFLDGKISRRQGELVESVVSAAREMGSEIAYTLKMRERQSGQKHSSVPSAHPGMSEGRGLEGRGFTLGGRPGTRDREHRDGHDGAGEDREAVHHFKKSVRKMFMMNAMDRAERERQEHRGFDRGSVVPQGPAFHTANRVAKRKHLHSRENHEETAQGLGPTDDGFVPSSGSSTPHRSDPGSKDRPGSTGSGLGVGRFQSERSDKSDARSSRVPASVGSDRFSKGDGEGSQPLSPQGAQSHKSSQGKSSDAFGFFSSLVEDAATHDGSSQDRQSTSRGRARFSAEGFEDSGALEQALGLDGSGGLGGALRHNSGSAGGTRERSAKELMLNSILQEIDRNQESAGSSSATGLDGTHAGLPTPDTGDNTVFARGAQNDSDEAAQAKKKGMNTILGDLLEAAREKQRKKDRGERVELEDHKDAAALGRSWMHMSQRRNSQRRRSSEIGDGWPVGGLVPDADADMAERGGESSRVRGPRAEGSHAQEGFDWETLRVMMLREGKRITIPAPWNQNRRDMPRESSRNQPGSDGEAESDGQDSDKSPVSLRPPAPAAAASTGFRGAKVRQLPMQPQPLPASSSVNCQRVRKAKDPIDLERVYQHRALRFHRSFYESFPSYAPQLSLIPVVGRRSKKPRGKQSESRQPIMPFRSTCFCSFPKRLLPEIETYPIVTEDFSESVYSLSLEHSRASWSDTSTLLADTKPSKKRERSKGLREFHKHFSAVLP